MFGKNMTNPTHNTDIFRWRRFTQSKTPATKAQLSNGEIEQWMKRVEMASEFAVSEVFSLKRDRSGTSSQTMVLEKTEQLQDHDEAYTEAQALLSDWMNRKLRLELEMEEEEEDDLIGPAERSCPLATPPAQPAHLNYSNFDDLYSHLAEEEESCAVSSFLQDLMEREVLDSGTAEDLTLDSEQEKKRGRDPSVTMEERHRQVRANRARRDADRERQRREREWQREAREEAQRREQEEERERRRRAQQQEDMVQKEAARLRRQMAERRSLEQQARQRERQRLDRKKSAKTPLVPDSGLSLTRTPQQQHLDRLHRQQQAEARGQMLDLQCLQRHFSGWYSVLLERKVCMGKAAALSDWRRQLGAWRAWRALVWAGREQREAERTEEELRVENRHCQVATESDRRRLLRRCLNDWRLWCWTERERRELLAQQEDVRRKMAALIKAAASKRPKTPVPLANEPTMVQPEAVDLSETTDQQGHQRSQPVAPAPSSPACQGVGPLGPEAPPTQAWQVTRRHAALSSGELRRTREDREEAGGGGGGAPRRRSAELRGGRFEHRHASQQQVIQEQRRLLREQQEHITQLQEEKSMMGLKQEAQRATQTLQPAPPAQGLTSDPEEPRAGSIPMGNTVCRTALRKPPACHPRPHPSIMAMEERAGQRARRRTELEELKRKKEEDKLAQMKAAEEKRQREEEEEKRRAMERRRDERRQERERDQERQRRLERDQQLQTLAEQHFRQTLLLRRGLAPWKRLLDLCRDNAQLAGLHHGRCLLRRCILSWQLAAGESLAQKQAPADRLHRHFLLRRSWGSWRRLRDQSGILEGRAKRFHRTRSLRRALTALLDHVTRERLAQWDRQRQAEEHSARRALRSCFLAWRRLPRLQREERQREERREKLRRRVAEVLPDFRSSLPESPWERPPP